MVMKAVTLPFAALPASTEANTASDAKRTAPTLRTNKPLSTPGRSIGEALLFEAKSMDRLRFSFE
jgi:hypothetical protein